MSNLINTIFIVNFENRMYSGGGVGKLLKIDESLSFLRKLDSFIFTFEAFMNFTEAFVLWS